jgi:regulator of cell morphogenesis and NO signaling
MTIIEEKDVRAMADATVADVATLFPDALEILNRYNLDYCCGGKKPFVEVCEKAGLDAESIWREIQSVTPDRGADNRMRFDTWDSNLLIDFIIQHHHKYVRESIPMIQELLDKVCEVHKEDSPFLLAVRDRFSRLAEELLNHLPKEEEILFPAARKLFNYRASADSQGGVPLHLDAPISVMEHEHDEAGRLIKGIRALTDNYTPPGFACPTYKITYVMLSQFDKDLMQHIHLENNILFPKILEAQGLG